MGAGVDVGVGVGLGAACTVVRFTIPKLVNKATIIKTLERILLR